MPPVLASALVPTGCTGLGSTGLGLGFGCSLEGPWEAGGCYFLGEEGGALHEAHRLGIGLRFRLWLGFGRLDGLCPGKSSPMMSSPAPASPPKGSKTSYS